MKKLLIIIIGVLLWILLFTGCDLSSEDSTAFTPSTIVFEDGSGAAVSKQLGSGNYTNTVTGDGTGSITYTSGTLSTATIDSSTGEVTLLTVGSTVITAVKAATTTHETVTNTYTLTVVYLVGDIGPAGGWIFYDDEADGVDDIDGFRYLEAAPADISETKVWGTYGTTVTGADGTAIGTGIENTLDIIASDTSTINAAHACYDYTKTNNGVTYTDWFLPSKDELNAMYDNLKENDLGGFVDNFYWSSSEDNNYYAWGQDFYDGYQTSFFKKYNRYVRPVRAF